MKALRRFSPGTGRRMGVGLVLLVLLAALAPSVCLLWFMNQAVQNERLAVRQRLADAYRGHLALAQERLEGFWRQTANDLDAAVDRYPAPALFAKLVRDGLADGVICFNAAGEVVYPNTLAAPKRESLSQPWLEAQQVESTDPALAAAAYAELAEAETNASLAARALQAQARCLVRAGMTNPAVALLTGALEEQRYQQAADAQGRLLVPNTELMALELLKNSSSEPARGILERLRQRLLDYDSMMPAAQRRFLMREFHRLIPTQPVFPTLAGEDLAARFLEAGQDRPARQELRASAIPGVWQFASNRGRVVALHQTENLISRMQAAISSQVLPSDVLVAVMPPGKETGKSISSMPAGAALPGWNLALSLRDERLFETAARQRIASYVWIGALVVGAVVLLALLALGLVRRQMALTQLRNDLVANVSHELKTPLSSMRLLVDTLLNSDTLPPQTAREYLQLIAQENARLSRLIDNFLTFSRIERKKAPFEFAEVAPGVIVEGAAAAVRERFNAPGCRFDVRTPAGLAPVVADADAIVTALVNLLDNAFKYSGDEKRITLSAAPENGSVCFRVQDNGIGLSPREMKRVFKRFYQVDQRLSRSSGGCGLGLSIVKLIADVHRGSVRVDSQPGRGSTFTLALPAS